MKNNKGFSLVELIIVIAIMAILVGVMAPQLIKYIEKSNVSADTQLAATIQTACVTAMMDPEVLADTSASNYINGLQGGQANIASFVGGTNKYTSAVSEILGETVAANITGSLKSANVNNNAKDISVTLSANSCTVIITNSDSRGSKGQNSWTATDQIGVY